MLIVVTGSSGSVGTATVAELLAHGHQVVPVDVQEPKRLIEGMPPTRMVDLRSADDLKAAFQGADAVCHLGNFPGFYRTGKATGFSNNVPATYNVFHVAHECGIRRIVNASSIQAYGSFGEAPMPPRYLPMDEEHPLQPRDAYPLSKAMSEHIADCFVRKDAKLSAWSLRFTTVLKPQPPAVAPIEPAEKGAANSLWTYIRCEDAALAVRLCCEMERPGHTPLNIVSPRPQRLWNPEAVIQTYHVMPEMRRAVAPDESLISAQRAKDLLGFVAEPAAIMWG